MSKPEYYDESPEMVRAIQEKAAQRAIRKAEYRKMMSDPYRWATQTVPVDIGLERFEAQRTLHGTYPHFKPTIRTLSWYICGFWIPVLCFAFGTKRAKENREHRYRTGQVAYKDRPEKFVC